MALEVRATKRRCFCVSCYVAEEVRAIVDEADETKEDASLLSMRKDQGPIGCSRPPTALDATVPLSNPGG